MPDKAKTLLFSVLLLPATAIFGVHPQLTARIELPGGSISDVKAGQNIPGTTYHVEKITPDSVVLEQSGTRKTLRP